MVAIVAWPSYRQKESLSYRREESQVTLLDGEYDEDPFVEKQPGRQPRKVSLAIVAGLITFFFLDFVAYLYIARMLLFHRPSEDELEFRNPYIGLNELYSSEEARPSKYDRIVNLPRLAAHVSWVEPDLVMPFDVHRWLTDFGYVSPPDRQLQVSSAVHSILQFGVMDYGMERCSLAIRLPSRGDALPHPYSLKDVADTVRLDMCELDAKRPLDERTITWNNRPTCIRNLGILDAKVGGEVQMDSFPCKSGAFLAYEISCASETPDCGIEVWSNQNETWGQLLFPDLRGLNR